MFLIRIKPNAGWPRAGVAIPARLRVSTSCKEGLSRLKTCDSPPGASLDRGQYPFRAADHKVRRHEMRRVPRLAEGQMNPAILQRYAAPVPRYTSYPTAPHFTAAVDATTYAAWLRQLPAGSELSIYVHIP